RRWSGLTSSRFRRAARLAIWRRRPIFKPAAWGQAAPPRRLLHFGGCCSSDARGRKARWGNALHLGRQRSELPLDAAEGAEAERGITVHLLVAFAEEVFESRLDREPGRRLPRRKRPHDGVILAVDRAEGVRVDVLALRDERHARSAAEATAEVVPRVAGKPVPRPPQQPRARREVLR